MEDRIAIHMTRDEANSIVELIELEIERHYNESDADDYEQVAAWWERLRDRILATPGVH